jgi:hypothetical protein
MKSGLVGWSVRGVVSLALSVSAACATSDAQIGFPAAGHSADSGMDEAGSVAAAGSGGDGLGGGVNAGEAAPAGAGGFAGSKAGVGGVGGSAAGAGAGAGGAGVGGIGGMLAAGSGGTSGAGGTCPTQYTTASHIVLNVTWDGSLAINSGSGKVDIWTKSKFVDNGTTATVESVSCGSVLPVIQETGIAGGKKVLPEIPTAAWDNANMPKFAGTSTKSGNTLTLSSGVGLVGLTMTNPTAAWPSATAITSADHDGDTKPGITAVPRDSGEYQAPPTSLSKTNFADKLYLATRNVMTMTATVAGCPQTYTGTANVTKFENHVIGCHVKGGGECNSTQAGFVDDNRTVYKVGTATFTSKVVSDNATCSEVRAALP